PGSGCDAKGGDNRLHAILGFSDSCIATHPSDFCVPLVAFDAILEIEGKNGRREIPVEAMHRLPGTAPERDTELKAGDLIDAVRLPPSARRFAGHARYLKVRERTSYAFAVVSAAAGLIIEGGVINEARLALGGVAAKPWRARQAEAVLAGARAEPASFQRAADAALAEAKPSGDNPSTHDLQKPILPPAPPLPPTAPREPIPPLPPPPFPPPPGPLHF